MKQQTCLSVGLGLGILLLVGAMPAQAQLPAWVKILQFSGDFRLRYQYEDETEVAARHRGRFRFRLAMDANILENLRVGFGIASGGDDPRSTNQNFEDAFSSKSIRIDLAFAEYRPAEWLDLIGGKFKQPLWTPSDLLWDSDIRPEGGALVLQYKLPPRMDLFVVAGVFVLDEVNDGADPLLVPLQGGVTLTLAKHLALQCAVTYYEFLDVQRTPLDFSSGTNTVVREVLAFDFNVVSVSAELGFLNIFGDVMPYIGLIGEYVHNFAPEHAQEGFLAGIKFGHKRISEGGQWQVQYFYRRLERDAWPDIFPDADFLNGETNVKGHKVTVVYGVWKYVEVGVAYNRAEEIAAARTKDVFQFDVMVKLP
jgi:hypothetical protein